VFNEEVPIWTVIGCNQTTKNIILGTCINGAQMHTPKEYATLTGKVERKRGSARRQHSWLRNFWNWCDAATLFRRVEEDTIRILR